MSRACGILMVLVLVTGNNLCGQDPSPPPAPGDGQTAPAPSSLPQEHIIYLPFENLRDVFEKQDSSIVLPYAQFLEMWNRLIQPDQTPLHCRFTASSVAPTTWGPSRENACSGGDVGRRGADGGLGADSRDIRRRGDRFGADADGAVLLRGVGEGQYELLVQGQGKHQIKLSLVTGVKSATEGRSFTVQCPPVGVSNLELEIPEKDLAVQVTPRRVRSCGPTYRTPRT